MTLYPKTALGAEAVSLGSSNSVQLKQLAVDPNNHLIKHDKIQISTAFRL